MYTEKYSSNKNAMNSPLLFSLHSVRVSFATFHFYSLFLPMPSPWFISKYLRYHLYNSLRFWNSYRNELPHLLRVCVKQNFIEIGSMSVSLHLSFKIKGGNLRKTWFILTYTTLVLSLFYPRIIVSQHIRTQNTLFIPAFSLSPNRYTKFQDLIQENCQAKITSGKSPGENHFNMSLIWRRYSFIAEWTCHCNPKAIQT